MWCWNVAALLLIGYVGGCCVGCGVNGSLFTKASPFHASVETSTDATKAPSLVEAKATSQSKTSYAKTSSSSAASRPLIKKIFRSAAKDESSSDVRVVKLPQQPKIPTEVIEQSPAPIATASHLEAADGGTNITDNDTNTNKPATDSTTIVDSTASSTVDSTTDESATKPTEEPAPSAEADNTSEANTLTGTDSAAEASSMKAKSTETTSVQESEPTPNETKSEGTQPTDTADIAKSDDVAATTPSVVDEQTPSTQSSPTVTAIHSEIVAKNATPMVAMHGNMPVTLETLTTGVVTPAAAEEHAVVSNTAMTEENLLTVQQLSLVREVKGFGKKVAFTNQNFRPGQSVILYAEVDRFETILDQNGYYTALRGVVVMRDMNGRIVFRQEPSVAEETCESKRRDYYLAQILTFPENLSIGRYRLEFFVEDCCSGRYGAATIEIEIR